MSKTNCKVHMEFADVTAVEDSDVSVNEMAAISNLDLLREESVYPSYAFLDLNNFILDGSKVPLEDESQIAFVSEVSMENCGFENNPIMDICFTQNHTSAGFTLYFVDEYPAEVKITWYDLNGVRLITKAFYPDKLSYFCRNQVENYGALQIEFVKTRHPGQRVKLGYILYGTRIDWSGSDIQAASLSEELDVTSATIPINTAEVSMLDSANDFDLSNQDGTWKSIQKRQPLSIIETVGSKDITCGSMFLDTWKSQNNVVSFSLIDTFGLIDKTKFYNGRIYQAEEAGLIIDEIMLSAGITDYYVAEEIRKIPLTGHIPICTHREAVQQVVFSCGAVAGCNRKGKIEIRMPDRNADRTIGTDRKFMGTTIEIDEYVSSVALSYNRYVLSEKREELYKDILPVGDTLIEFSDPCTDIEASVGILLDAKTNYALIHMDTEGECILTGFKYSKSEITYTANVEKIEAGEEAKTISYSGCTLLNAARAKEVAERLLNYYQLRQIVNMRYLLDEECVGEWVNVRDKNSTVVTGITSQSIDLTGGFIATAQCRGYSKVVTANVYAGEFYAGERGLI